MKNKRFLFIIIIAVIIMLLASYFYLQDNYLEITYISYENEKVKEAFDGFVIVQISDLHDKSFGKDNRDIFAAINSAKPDVIFITGDLVDRRRYDIDSAMSFVKGAADIAPVYYVPGNHEAWSGKYEEIEEQLISLGVNVLNDTAARFYEGNDYINIIGLSSVAFLPADYADYMDISFISEQIVTLSDENALNVLLSHRPELIKEYAKSEVDLVFSGHAHGGQFRIPFIGGLLAPDQGFFPKYSEGVHRMGFTTLIISRGLGNSVVPVRINNRPEIIVLELKCAE